MEYYQQFAYCPGCGRRYATDDFDARDSVFSCGGCGLDFYQNSISSASAVIPEAGSEDRVLLLTRCIEPGSGLLTLPGGILRYGEDVEEGMRREVREETGLTVRARTLLLIPRVRYHYRGYHIPVLEHAYLVEPVPAMAPITPNEEASALGFHALAPLVGRPERFSFPEQHDVLKVYFEALR